MKEFAQMGGKAKIFANDPANRKNVLDYRKETTDLFGNVLEITGAEAGQIFNNGWLDSEVDIIEITLLFSVNTLQYLLFTAMGLTYQMERC